MVTVLSSVFKSLSQLHERFARVRKAEQGSAKCEYVLLASLLSTAIIASTNPLSSAMESQLEGFTAALIHSEQNPRTGFYNDHTWMTTRDTTKHGLPSSGSNVPGEDGSSPQNGWMIAQNDNGGHSTGSTPGTGGNALHVGPGNLDDSNPPPRNGGGDGGDNGGSGSSGDSGHSGQDGNSAGAPNPRTPTDSTSVVSP